MYIIILNIEPVETETFPLVLKIIGIVCFIFVPILASILNRRNSKKWFKKVMEKDL